jgi:hypothetical protein
MLLVVCLALPMLHSLVYSQVSVTSESVVGTGGFNLTPQATVTIIGGKVWASHLNMES